MVTVHRFGGSFTQGDLEFLSGIGVTVKLVQGSTSGSFEVVEGGSHWAALSGWAEGRRLVHTVGTRFSDEDMSESSYLTISTAHRGYPPEDFALTTFRYSCPVCGWRDHQIAPFQVDRQFGARSGIVQLNWVFDELFASVDVFEAVFAPLGIERMPVHDRKGRALSSVVQLVISEGVDVKPATAVSECVECGRSRYLPHVKGRFPSCASPPVVDVFRTNQRFGSGRSSHRQIIVSQRLRRAIMMNRPRDAAFVPVEERA